jgi:hypothetical protein
MERPGIKTKKAAIQIRALSVSWLVRVRKAFVGSGYYVFETLLLCERFLIGAPFPFDPSVTSPVLESPGGWRQPH